MKKINLLLTIVTALSFYGCSERVVVTQPESVVMDRGMPPDGNSVWIENEYEWKKNEYVLVPGHYVRHEGVWIPGHWGTTSKGYRWVRGRWK